MTEDLFICMIHPRFPLEPLLPFISLRLNFLIVLLCAELNVVQKGFPLLFHILFIYSYKSILSKMKVVIFRPSETLSRLDWFLGNNTFFFFFLVVHTMRASFPERRDLLSSSVCYFSLYLPLTYSLSFQARLKESRLFPGALKICLRHRYYSAFGSVPPSSSKLYIKWLSALLQLHPTKGPHFSDPTILLAWVILGIPLIFVA